MSTSTNPLAPNPETNIDNPGFRNPPIAPEEPQEDPGRGVPIGEPDEDEDEDEGQERRADDRPM